MPTTTVNLTPADLQALTTGQVVVVQTLAGTIRLQLGGQS